MKKLLIVVDYQNDFVTGSLGFRKAQELEETIADKISEYREKRDEIAFTFDTHGEDYLETFEGRRLPVPHCIKETEGWQLYGRTACLISDEDKRFYKPAFGSAELFEYLKGKSYESVELAGVVSNICVISNAVLVKTALPEVPVIVDCACTASNDYTLNEAALKVMEGLQIELLNRKQDDGDEA